MSASREPITFMAMQHVYSYYSCQCKLVAKFAGNTQLASMQQQALKLHMQLFIAAKTVLSLSGRAAGITASASYLTVSNGVGEGHHDNGEECRDGIPSAAPGDGRHIHHHEGPHHQQGRPHCIWGDASCMHTHIQSKHNSHKGKR